MLGKGALGEGGVEGALELGNPFPLQLLLLLLAFQRGDVVFCALLWDVTDRHLFSMAYVYVCIRWRGEKGGGVAAMVEKQRDCCCVVCRLCRRNS